MSLPGLPAGSASLPDLHCDSFRLTSTTPTAIQPRAFSPVLPLRGGLSPNFLQSSAPGFLTP